MVVGLVNTDKKDIINCIHSVIIDRAQINLKHCNFLNVFFKEISMILKI